MTSEELLSEVEDLLRTMPPRETMKHPLDANYAWLGRAAALVESWNHVMAIPFRGYMDRFHSLPVPRDWQTAFSQMLTMLHQARNDLRMKTIGPLSAVIGQGMVFDYFDEIRKIIEIARTDVFFVDPYLDSEFVSRYLGHVASEVAVRLLAREKLATLNPAVQLFAQQSQLAISVRSAPGFHDSVCVHRPRLLLSVWRIIQRRWQKCPDNTNADHGCLCPHPKVYEDLWNTAIVYR
jgi:hypothetical protein